MKKAKSAGFEFQNRLISKNEGIQLVIAVAAVRIAVFVGSLVLCVVVFLLGCIVCAVIGRISGIGCIILSFVVSLITQIFHPLREYYLFCPL